jgi:hypothetical protein
MTDGRKFAGRYVWLRLALHCMCFGDLNTILMCCFLNCTGTFMFNNCRALRAGHLSYAHMKSKSD